MLISEMHIEFKERMDKMDSFQNPNLEPEQIDLLFNISQDELIKELTKDGLEKTQTSQDYLKNILENFKTSTFTNTVDNKPNGVFITLPSNYRKAVQEEAKITCTNCKGNTVEELVDVIPTTHGQYNEVRKDPFKRANNNKIIRLSVDEKFELICSTDNIITDYYLRYYREPVSMQYGTQYPTPTTDVNCELSIEAQREIIKKAVVIASKSLENINKYQIEAQSLQQIN